MEPQINSMILHDSEPHARTPRQRIRALDNSAGYRRYPIALGFRYSHAQAEQLRELFRHPDIDPGENSQRHPPAGLLD
jgi:hypothetical protein